MQVATHQQRAIYHIKSSGAASDLIDAKENQGMGTWVNTFGKDATEAETKRRVICTR